MSESVLTSRPGAIATAARPLRPVSLIERLNIRGTLLVGLVMLAVILLVALLAPFIAPYNPIEQNLGNAFAAPLSRGHLLGTDNFGRDILSRIIYGTRLDLQIGFFSVVF